MKKILLILFAIIISSAIIFALFYIKQSSVEVQGEKRSFIPYNSAVVLNINNDKSLGQVRNFVATFYSKQINELLRTTVDTVLSTNLVEDLPFSLALRIEGPANLSYMYLLDIKDILNTNQTEEKLKQIYKDKKFSSREYDNARICNIRDNKHSIYFAAVGGILLISNSGLYIEDGIKQFISGEKTTNTTRYQNIDKFFSNSADFNIFLNRDFFGKFSNMLIQNSCFSSKIELEKLFKWGALDADYVDNGVSVNGFISYSDIRESYAQVLKGQKDASNKINKIIPAAAQGITMLSLSDLSLYMSKLNDYRKFNGSYRSIDANKQRYAAEFGKVYENRLLELLPGEFAQVILSYNASYQKKEGLNIARVRSGSLTSEFIREMMLTYCQYHKTDINKFISIFSVDKDKDIKYYKFPEKEFSQNSFGDLFAGIENNYVTVVDNYLIFASSRKALESMIKSHIHSNFLVDEDWYVNLKSKLADKSNLSFYQKTEALDLYYRDMLQKERLKGFTTSDKLFASYKSMGLVFSSEDKYLYTSFHIGKNEVESELAPHLMWQSQLEGKQVLKPFIATNHMTGEKEILVQDDKNSIYLINNAGRKLWKINVDGKITGTIYQVDAYKNNKLQFLFSTENKIYLIDRNGNNVGRFPISLPSKSTKGISVFDYDKNKNYRIFIPLENKKVYLYGIDGNPIKGWNPKSSDNKITSIVKHYAVNGRDYLIYSDKSRLYILDRQGKERIAVKHLFDIADDAYIYLVNEDKEAKIVLNGNKGCIYKVNFKGQVEKIVIDKLATDFKMNINNTLKGYRVILSAKDKLIICDLNGKVILDKKIDKSNLGFPHLYRFSSSDIRIGCFDEVNNKIYMINLEGDLTAGFPIEGDSPYSIILSNDGIFYLYTGIEGRDMIKYKIKK